MSTLVRIAPASLVASHTNGGFDYTAMWKGAPPIGALRVHLHIDHSYAWQSALGVAVFTAVGWKEIHTLAPDDSRSQKYSSYRNFPSEPLRAAVEADEDTLLHIATAILATP